MTPPSGLESLYREFDRERPSVLVVVGAGVSFGATGKSHASWRGLLEHGVRTLRDKGKWNQETARANLTLIQDAFTSDFDLDEVLMRAESIARALGAPDGDDYRLWLEQSIGALQARDGRKSTLEAIAALEGAGALILTTNYDDLLCDACGLEPVTWEDHREFLRVLNREREGILHIHGHWKQPSSVVLGRSSYARICAAKDLQDVFNSVWMNWSWLYIGCGNGLDDQNVGRLLRWGHLAFGDAARRDYFLGLTTIAESLAARPDKPANLLSIGYSDHSELPTLLRLLTPQQRPDPFVALGPTNGPVRHPTTSPLGAGA